MSVDVVDELVADVLGQALPVEHGERGQLFLDLRGQHAAYLLGTLAKRVALAGAGEAGDVFAHAAFAFLCMSLAALSFPLVMDSISNARERGMRPRHMYMACGVIPSADASPPMLPKCSTARLIPNLIFCAM